MDGEEEEQEREEGKGGEKQSDVVVKDGNN